MEISLKPDRLSWQTVPSGGDLTHVLTIKVTLTTEQRSEVEDLVTHYWEHACVLSGNPKPEQSEMFDVQGFEEQGKDLAD